MSRMSALQESGLQSSLSENQQGEFEASPRVRATLAGMSRLG